MASYPALANGAKCQLPIVKTDVWATVVSDMETGQHFSYSTRPTQLRRWELEYPAIPATDKGTIAAFFSSQKGRLIEFDIIDPEDLTTVIPHARFGMDALEIQMAGPGVFSMRVIVEELP